MSFAFLELVGLTSEQAARVKRDPRQVWSGEFDETLSLEDGWHGLHYLLTETAYDGECPLGFLIGGGDDLGDDGEWISLLSPAEVAAVADALNALSEETLRARFDPQRMETIGVEPAVWEDEDSEPLEWLIGLFNDMRRFIARTAERQMSLVITVP